MKSKKTTWHSPKQIAILVIMLALYTMFFSSLYISQFSEIDLSSQSLINKVATLILGISSGILLANVNRNNMRSILSSFVWLLIVNFIPTLSITDNFTQVIQLNLLVCLQFVTNTIYLIAISLLVYILVESVNKKSNSALKRKSWILNVNTNYIFELFITFGMMNGILIQQLIEKVLLPLYWSNDREQLSQKGMIFAYLWIFALILFSLLFTNLLKKVTVTIKKRRTNWLVTLFTSVLCSNLVSFWLQKILSVDGHTLSASAYVIQVSLLTAFFFSVYLVINRFILTTSLLASISGLFLLVTYLKFTMRNSPIENSDLEWLSNPTQLAKFISPINQLFLVLIVSIPLLTGIFLLRRVPEAKVLGSVRIRVALLSISLMVLSFINWENMKVSSSPSTVARNPIRNLFIVTSNNGERFRGNAFLNVTSGYFYNFLSQRHSSVMEVPNGYSQNKMMEIEERYKEVTRHINETRNHVISDRTVIYVLSESLANPTRIPGLSFSKNPMPFIDNLAKHGGGLMISSGYGGGTSNIEIEAITSLAKNNYSSSISTINTDVIPKLTYIPAISNQFKLRTIVHLNYAENYNRTSLYNKLDFDSFIAEHGGTVDITKIERLSEYASDAFSYQTVLNSIKPNTGQFIELLTMQNHSSYDHPAISHNISFTDKLSTTKSLKNNELQYYLSVIQETDNATSDFINDLKKIQQPVSVVFYGDHLPGLYQSSRFDSNPESQYQTDYFIWSNDNAESARVEKNTAPYLLTAQLLRATDSKVTPYYAMLTEILEKLPIMQNGKLYDSTTGETLDQYLFSPDQEKLAADYRLIQYDLTSGKGYLSKDFYE